MAKVTPTELIATANQLVQDHECQYAQELLDTKELQGIEAAQDLGGVALLLTRITNLAIDLRNFHRGNTCPPTYHGRAITPESRAWSTQLALTRVSAARLGQRAATLAA